MPKKMRHHWALERDVEPETVAIKHRGRDILTMKNGAMPEMSGFVINVVGCEVLVHSARIPRSNWILSSSLTFTVPPAIVMARCRSRAA